MTADGIRQNHSLLMEKIKEANSIIRTLHDSGVDFMIGSYVPEQLEYDDPENPFSDAPSIIVSASVQIERL